MSFLRLPPPPPLFPIKMSPLTKRPLGHGKQECNLRPEKEESHGNHRFGRDADPVRDGLSHARIDVVPGQLRNVLAIGQGIDGHDGQKDGQILDAIAVRVADATGKLGRRVVACRGNGLHVHAARVDEKGSFGNDNEHMELRPRGKGQSRSQGGGGVERRHGDVDDDTDTTSTCSSLENPDSYYKTKHKFDTNIASDKIEDLLYYIQAVGSPHSF